jgi:hypothetical protein
MQQNEPGPSVLEYLSFEADQTTQDMTMPTTPNRYGSSSTSGPNGTGKSMHMQGLLWKRRDVFKNRWRPRWFVLHPDQRVLTYYLLANQDTERVVSGSTSSTPGRRPPTNARGTSVSSSMSVSSATRHNNDSQGRNRRRTFSESSTVSARTIDCDVVPRGSIYLQGSTVEANEALSSPQEEFFALTISNHEKSTHCHLAARTVESRDQWIHRIRRLCQPGNEPQSQEQEDTSSHESNRAPYSLETSFFDLMGTTKKIDTSGLQQNDGNIDTNNNASGSGPIEKEILVLCTPLILYKVLTTMSIFGLAAFCFVVTSTIALQWVLLQHILTIARPLINQNQNESSGAIGNGSICCRVKVDLMNSCSSEREVSHIMVWSLAKAINQQPGLVSKKYNLLPRFYSTDVMYLDLNDTAGDESDGVLVSNAGEKNLDEIAKVFTVTNEQRCSRVSFLQKTIGPACRIVTTTFDDNDGDDIEVQQVQLTDCPITVFVEEKKTNVASISISFKSTNVHACRQFVENFKQSVREVC